MNLFQLNKQPINIELISVTEEQIKRLGLQEVTEPQIFEANSSIFHTKGLFSTTIFGAIGSEHRNRIFAYIDLHIPVLHPIVYYAITSLSSFYKKISEGSELAEWDPKTKTFIKSKS